MRLVISRNRPEMDVWAAHYIAKKINEFPKNSKVPFVLGLGTGSSLIGIYKNLAELAAKGEVSFDNVVTFNLDEFCGIPENHPASYHSYMFEHFFSLISIPPANVNFLNGNAEDLDAECDRYEDKIKKLGGIDLFICGIGPDGHIGFNEPGSSLDSITRPKTLSYESILSLAPAFNNNPDNVPRMALTCGIQTLMAAHEIMVAVNGSQKAFALSKIVEGGVSHMCPVSAIQLHPKSVVVCDKDATLELKVKTVRYFKGLMKEYKSSHPNDPLGLMTLPSREEDIQHSMRKQAIYEGSENVLNISSRILPGYGAR